MGMRELIIKVDDPSERAWDGSSKVFETKELVRCKDCKHGKIHGIDVECVAHEEVGYDPEPWHPLDWFCADGVKKYG